jgi:hypothetical protein
MNCPPVSPSRFSGFSALAVALSILSSPALFAADYHVDSILGSDARSGLSPELAWRTLNPVNSRNFSPGDRILLKRGQTVTGVLDLSGETGTAANPILVSDYGDSPGRAAIDATGQSSAIDVSACEYIEVENLEIIGRGIRGEAWNWRSSGKAWDHYHFRNLHIHDTANSGINLIVSNLGGYTYRDISVTDCVFENITGTGISINKWAGEAIKTVDNIGPADPARIPGIYTSVQAVNLTRSQIIPAEFTVTISQSGAASMEVTVKGAGYKENDQLLIDDADLGGGGAADLTVRVNEVLPADPNGFYHQDLVIRGNTISNTTEAGMQIGKFRNGLIEGNTVNDTGDGTGGSSGLWTWFCGTPSTTFIIQRNVFSGARGETDACGVHIDIGCVNNIVQYNLSMNNEGGFMEILGNAFNCVYRYNISINDGARVNGTGGALQEGRTFYLGGYTGRRGPKLGPYNSYIYNNTIYVSSDITASFEIESTAEGALFANNVIYIEGSSEDVNANNNGSLIIFDNNLVYQSKVPMSPFNSFINNWDADPQFLNAGGNDPEEYEPIDKDEVVNRGIPLYALPGDSNGVAGGFAVSTDFFGNPIIGQPDMGAIEASAAVHWLVENGFSGNSNFNLDLNGDGATLLEAYALNLDPKVNNAANRPTLRPGNNGDSLTMDFFGEADGVTYTVLKSRGLKDWTPVDSTWLQGPDIDGMSTVAVPIHQISPRLFLRLDLNLE